MIAVIFTAIVTSVIWSLVSNTEFAWVSYLCAIAHLICLAVANHLYDKLLNRVTNLENKLNKK